MDVDSSQKELIAEDTAKKVARNFLSDKYWAADIKLCSSFLTDMGGIPVYHLGGEIKMKERGMVSQFIQPSTKYAFIIDIHALLGKVLGYQVT